MNVLDGEITVHSYVTTLKVHSSASVLMVLKMIKVKAGNANLKVHQSYIETSILCVSLIFKFITMSM